MAIKASWHYTKAHSGNEAMFKLEQEVEALGGPPAKGDFEPRMGPLNTRIKELESLKASLKSGKPAVAPTPAPQVQPVTIPTAPTPAKPVASTAAGRPTRKQLERISTEVYRTHILNNGEDLASLSDDALFSRIERLAFQDHLRVPGMRPDSELVEAGIHRSEQPTGLARVLRAARKEHLQKILSK